MTDEKTKTEAPAVLYRYVDSGGGHFVGVPPRDLTKAEFDALSDADKENVTKSGLYKKEAGNARSKD